MADILETAAQQGIFRTWVNAMRNVEASGIPAPLTGGGPYTVFAPTDAAFARLAPETRRHLLANPAAMATVLRRHVVPGRVTVADVVRLDAAPSLPTLDGGRVHLSAWDAVTVDQAHLLAADLLADNGVIHAIDAVLLPN